jgi:transposase
MAASESVVMMECPVCNTIRPYKLADGRFKCRACGTRFSWTSAWDSVRLEAATKHRLTEMFVLGVPIYRLRHRKDASAPTKERYYRLLRACCALAEGLGDPFQAGPGGHIMLRITEAGGKIAVTPVAIGAEPEAAGFISRPQRTGRPWFIDPQHALVMLALKGEHVLIGGNGEAGPATWSNPVISAFWSQARKGMETLRGMRLRYFHLHLGEACYRYNHRDADLKPLLLALMRGTTIREINQVIADPKPARLPPHPLSLPGLPDDPVNLEALPHAAPLAWAGAAVNFGTDHAAE